MALADPRTCGVCRAHRRTALAAEDLMEKYDRLSADGSPLWREADYLDVMRQHRLALESSSRHLALHTDLIRASRRRRRRRSRQGS